MRKIIIFLFITIVNYQLSIINCNAQNVGVDVASPVEKLDVLGAIRLGTTSNTNAGTIRWNSPNFQGYDGTQWINFGGGTLTGSGTATRVAFWSGTSALSSSANLYWDNTNSRLGVGITTPLGVLSAGSTLGNKVLAYDDGTSAAGLGIQASALQMFTSNNTSNIVFGYGSSGSFTENMRIMGTGNVGIGTTTPASKLQVFQSAGANNTNVFAFGDFAGKGYLAAGGGLVAISTNDGVARIVIPQSGAATGSVGIGTTPVNKLDVEGGLAVGATYSGTSTAPTNGAIIEGNVGIGTNSPLQKLQVKGGNALFVGGSGTTEGIEIMPRNSNGNAGGRIYFREDNNDLFGISMGYNGGNAGNEILNWPANTFNITTHSNDATGAIALTILRTTGNVGIGTTAPAQVLDVNGKIQMRTGATAGYVPVSDVNGTMTWTNPTSLTITETDPQISSTTTNKIPKWNGTTLVDGIAYDNGTNIGIGTTSPLELLELSKTGSDNYLRVNAGDPSTYSSGIKLYEPTFNFGWNMRFDANDDDLYFEHNNAGTITTLMKLDNLGNVGIGTTAPDRPLTVQGTGVNNELISLKNSAGTTKYHWNLSGGGLNLAETGVADGRIYVKDATGNVGIGTTTPTQKLDVAGKIQMQTGATAGYVPVSDANGTMTWTNPTSLTITETDPQVSSTTTNYIPKWNGTTLVDGVAYDNGTNVGIGTTAPAYKLDVVGGSISSSDNYYIGNTGGTGTTPFRIDGSSNKLYILAENGADGSASGTEIRFRTATTNSSAADRMTINNNGNVGIGTTTPAQKLDVAGKIQMQTGAAVGYVPVSDANGTMTWTNLATSSTAYLDEIRDADNNTKIQVEESANEDKIRFDMAGTEYLVMTAGRLNVVNTGGSTFLGQDAGLADDLSNNFNTFTGYFSGKATTTGYDNTAYGAGSLEKNVSGSNNTAIGRLAMLNRTSGGSNTAVGQQALYDNISGSNNTALGLAAGQNSTGSGNVFIGYAAGFSETGNDKLYIDNSTTASPLIYGDFSSNILTVNGNVGIGTTAPAQALDVNGKIQMQTGATAGYVPVSDANGTMTWTNPTSLTITETDPQVSSTTTNKVPKWNGTTLTDGTIFDNGNVGIGATTPLELLELSKSGADNYIRVNAGSSTANSTGIKLNEDGLNFGWNMRFDANDDDLYFEHNNTGAITKIMKLDNGGNIGIGTTAPGAYLDITGTNAGTTSLQLRSGNTNVGTSSNQITLGYSGSENYRHAIKTRHNSGGSGNNAIDFYVWKFGTDAAGTIGTQFVMSIDGGNGGSVGIGTTAPVNKLDVEGGMALGASYSGTSAAPTNGAIIEGNVGIGTTAPTQLLDVNGQIRMRTGATTGYVPVSDANGTMTWTNPTSLSITETDPQVSSTTTNYIPKWNGTALVDGVAFDNGTNIGIGTTSPSYKLDVVGGSISSSDNYFIGNTSGTGTNNPPFRLDGFSDKLYFIAESNATGPATGTEIRFRTATTNSSATDRMTINNNGNVGIGTTSPAYKLQVVDNFADITKFVLTVQNTGNSAGSLGMLIQAGEDSYTANNRLLRFNTPNGTQIGAVAQASSSSVSFNTTSDRRLKTNINPTKIGLTDLMNIPVYDYEYKTDPGKTQVGFVAQELYTVLPTAVTVGGDDAKTDPWMVDYSKLTPLLVKAVQELNYEKDKQIQELQTQVSELKNENTLLKSESTSKINSMQAQIDMITEHLNMKTEK